MPCYTLVQVTVKDEVLARKALKKLGLQADIIKNANGTFTVTPKVQSFGFKDQFLQRYAMEKATVEARKEGYTVVEKTENGEQVMYLRQY
jgi:hypothetical protein